MGSFDDFVDDDDDVAPPPIPTPLAPSKEAFTVSATGYHELADLVTYCQGKCSPEQLKHLKTLYMKRKERRFTVVEFLREAQNALGTDLLMQAMVFIRIDEKVSKSRAKSQSHQQTPGSNKTDGIAPTDERTASGSHSTKKVDGEKKNAGNMDVAQEADDVLAIAGVNADDEAKLLFAKQADGRRAEALSGFQSKDKDQTRKLIELRLFARIDGKDGLAKSKGVEYVNEQVYDYLEEALQVRLKDFVEKVSRCATKRNDANKSAFKQSHVAMEPKQQIRKINVALEREKAERVERERQALLRVGQSIMNKRKRDLEENTFLKEKVAKVQQEEEERIRAAAANQAARDALGDAKYLKWFDMAKSNTASGAAAKPQSGPSTSEDRPDVKSKEIEANKAVQPSKEANAFDKLRANAAAAATKSIILKDCLEALRDDEHGSRLLSLHASRR